MEKESVDEGLADEEAEDLKEAHNERMKLMVDDIKPQFTNI